MVIADEYFLKETNVFAETKYDVNGRPVTGSTIIFDGYPPNAKGDPLRDHTSFTLKLGPQATVVSMEAILPKDPTNARTQEQYDATHVYETVAAVTANACPALGRDEVAKWIENSIKPNSRFLPPEHEDKSERSAVHGFKQLVSKNTAFCNRVFEFHSESGTIQHGFEHDPFDTMRVIIE